jgi:DNA-binding GntR family transcriptional regulator
MSETARVFGDLRINRLTTAEQVAAVLRERMIDGSLQPGFQLREVPIAESIGVSRNTVREAFRLLSAEGLVQHSLHRGITVTKLSHKGLLDIFEARRTLELAALPRIKVDHFSAIEKAISELDRAIRADDSKRVVESDFAFHIALVHSIGSDRLSDFFASLLTELRLALAIADRKRDQDRAFAEEHVAIFDALRESNIGIATKLLNAHLDTSQAITLTIINEQSRDEGVPKLPLRSEA